MGHMTLMRRTGVERTVSSASNLTTIFELHDVNAPVFESPKGREPHGIGLKVRTTLVVLAVSIALLIVKYMITRKSVS